MNFFEVVFLNRYSEFADINRKHVHDVVPLSAMNVNSRLLQEYYEDPEVVLIKSKKLVGASLEQYLWKAENLPEFFEEDSYLAILINKLAMVGFKLKGRTKETFTICHPSKKINFRLFNGHAREVMWQLDETHADRETITRYRGDSLGLLGKFMSQNSTTESHLDFYTLEELYERIIKAANEFGQQTNEVKIDLNRAITVFGRVSALRYLNSLDNGSTDPKGASIEDFSTFMVKAFKQVNPDALKTSLDKSHDSELIKIISRRKK